MNKELFLKISLQHQNFKLFAEIENESWWTILSKGVTVHVVGLTILHPQALEQVFVGDPQDDVTGVRHPSQEEVDLGWSDKRRQVILPPQLFHSNKATCIGKASLSHQSTLMKNFQIPHDNFESKKPA